MKECHKIDGYIVAIDVEILRGSYDKGRRLCANHVIRKFSTKNGGGLGQLKLLKRAMR